MSDNQPDVTVADVKIQRLTARLGRQEERHSAEVIEMEVQYLLQIQELSNENQALRAQVQSLSEVVDEDESGEEVADVSSLPRARKTKSPSTRKK